MNFRRTTSVAGAAMLAIATMTGVPALAHADAADAADAATETVRYDDLNLSTPAGVQALYHRIQSAARNVCGPSVVTGTRIVSEGWKDCVSTTVHKAIFEVNKPPLTAYYANHLRDPISRTAG